MGTQVIVLGSGTSHGIPMIGCRCEVCRSSDPRDRRTRPSVFWSGDGVDLLIDCPPELRLQCVANHVAHVDAVLFTHHHADHVVGLDDLRRFNWINKRPIPCYGSPRTLVSLRRMFAYAFEPAPDSPHSRPQLELHEIGEESFDVCGQRVMPIPLMHGPLPVLGFRIGDFAYCTDCSVIPESSRPLLQNLDVLILDALRIDAHPTHFNLVQAVEMAGCIGAKQTYFTHMAHQIKHADIDATLQDGMHLAYDGLQIAL